MFLLPETCFHYCKKDNKAKICVFTLKKYVLTLVKTSFYKKKYVFPFAENMFSPLGEIFITGKNMYF